MGGHIDDQSVVTLVGLVFDIVGVGMLFYSTSTRRIESEILFPAFLEFSQRDEKEQRELARWGNQIRRNIRMQRVALLSIIFGFVLQAAGVVVQVSV